MQGNKTFLLGFEDRPPALAAVASKIADMVIQEGSAERFERAEATSSFVRTRWRRCAKLAEQEREIEQYKARHFAELPESQGVNQAVVDTSREQLEAKRRPSPRTRRGARPSPARCASSSSRACAPSRRTRGSRSCACSSRSCRSATPTSIPRWRACATRSRRSKPPAATRRRSAADRERRSRSAISSSPPKPTPSISGCAARARRAAWRSVRWRAPVARARPLRATRWRSASCSASTTRIACSTTRW